MNETRRTHLEAIPPVPAIDSSLPALRLHPSFALSMSRRFPLGSILGGIVSVQAGAALAKGGLFPALAPIGTLGLRVVRLRPAALHAPLQIFTTWVAGLHAHLRLFALALRGLQPVFRVCATRFSLLRIA